MPDDESISDLSDVVDAINKLCDNMKTSYDGPFEEETDAADTDEYRSYETPVSESYTLPESNETSASFSHEVSVAQGYEASFAKCKVPSVAESNEAPPAESYSATFAKCTLAPVVESQETPVTETYESQTVKNYESSFTKCSLPPVTESYETPLTENYEPPVVEKEAEIVNVIPQTDGYTPNMPPPVPKRTLLPSKTTKETTVPLETPQQEIPVVKEKTDTQNIAYRDIELVSPEEVVQKVETGAERWSDSTSVSLPGQVEDVETVSSDPGNAQCEPVSEMYYTASSEVSLLSDTELADKVQTEEDESKDDRKNVISGHVAAMRERFESMTRTNTPCPDLIRSLSPSLEVFRNMSPSPDRLA